MVRGTQTPISVQVMSLCRVVFDGARRLATGLRPRITPPDRFYLITLVFPVRNGTVFGWKRKSCHLTTAAPPSDNAHRYSAAT